MVWNDLQQVGALRHQLGNVLALLAPQLGARLDGARILAARDIDEFVAEQIGGGDRRIGIDRDVGQDTCVLTSMSNSTARLGSRDPRELQVIEEADRDAVKPDGRAIRHARRRPPYRCTSSSFCWKMPRELVSRNTRTNTMTNAVRATTPTFSCDHRTFSRSAIVYTRCFTNFDIYGSVDASSRSWSPSKISRPSRKHHEGGPRAPPRPVTCRLQTPLFRIVAEIRDQVPVLIAMRHHQRGGVADITLFDQ